MPTYEYYELRGVGPLSKKEMPSGMFRIVKTANGQHYERITLNGQWKMDNTLVACVAGYSDDATKISKKKAEKFIKYLKSGQAAKDKRKGTWR